MLKVGLKTSLLFKLFSFFTDNSMGKLIQILPSSPKLHFVEIMFVGSVVSCWTTYFRPYSTEGKIS